MILPVKQDLQLNIQLLYSFFQEAERICASDYLPSEMDVLRARTKTTGIYETRFQMGQLSIQYVTIATNWQIFRPLTIQ